MMMEVGASAYPKHKHEAEALQFLNRKMKRLMQQLEALLRVVLHDGPRSGLILSA